MGDDLITISQLTTSLLLFFLVGSIECEAPNNRLHKFVGTLDWKGHVYSLDNDNILLRVISINKWVWL